MDKLVKNKLDVLDEEKNKNFYGRVYGREFHKKILIQQMFKDELETMIETGVIKPHEINTQVKTILNRLNNNKLTLDNLNSSISAMECDTDEGDKIVDRIKYLKNLSSVNDRRVSAVQHSLDSWAEYGSIENNSSSNEKVNVK